MPEKVLKDGTRIISIDPVPLIQYIEEKYLKDKIIRIECPRCGHFIDIDHIKCGCDLPKETNIFKGCRDCGMQIGRGAFRVRAVACVSCGYELDFFEPYPLGRGRLQLKNEDQDILINILISVGITCGIIFLIVIVLVCLH